MRSAASGGISKARRSKIAPTRTPVPRDRQVSTPRRAANRVLYTIDALHPDRARLVVLPNLRRAQGLAFYAEEGAGVCLQIPMPVD